LSDQTLTTSLAQVQLAFARVTQPVTNAQQHLLLLAARQIRLEQLIIEILLDWF
jgi:hypothetical protein